MPIHSQPIPRDVNAPNLEALDSFIALVAAGAKKEEIIRLLSDPEKGESLIKVIQSLMATRQTSNAGKAGVKRERAESPDDIDDNGSVEYVRGPGRKHNHSSSLVRLDEVPSLAPFSSRGNNANASRITTSGPSSSARRTDPPLLPNHSANRGNNADSSLTTSSARNNNDLRTDVPLVPNRLATTQACPPLPNVTDFLLGTSLIDSRGMTSPRKWLNSDLDTLVDHSMSFIAIIAANILTPTFPETQKRYIVLHFGNNDWSLLYVPSTVGLYKDPALHFTFKEGTLVHLKNVFVHESKQRHLLKFTETSFIEKVDTGNPLKHCAEFNARLNAQHR